MGTVTWRSVIWGALALVLANSTWGFAMVSASTGGASVSMEVGQAYTLNTPPCDRQNSSSCPPTTKAYIADSYAFMPGKVFVGSNLIAQGLEYEVHLSITNVDPRGINHTFTLASTSGLPVFVLKLDSGGPVTVPRDVSLSVGERVRVNGGPPLDAVISTARAGERVVNFYCSYHKDKGMVGQLILTPTHSEAVIVKNGTQPSSPFGKRPQDLGLVGAAAIPVVGLPLVALYLRISRRRRAKPGGRR